MWVSHALGRRCTSFSFPCTRLILGQEAARRCPRHLCRGRPCSVEQKSFPGLGEIFPTKVAATEKFQQKITFVASQCFVKHSIFCWKILYPLPPPLPALPSSGSARQGRVRNEFTPLLRLQPQPAGFGAGAHSLILLQHRTGGNFSREAYRGAIPSTVPVTSPTCFLFTVLYKQQGNGTTHSKH